MSVLLLRLAGPMQSWGTTSRFDQRDTGKEPSKSGVIGLLAAAMGIDRADWQGIEPLARSVMAVRHDRPGVPRLDYQTAGAAKCDAIIKADGSTSKAGVVSRRHFLADAVFLTGLEVEDESYLTRIYQALRAPAWPLFLGRKSYVPSEPVWLREGIWRGPLAQAMRRYPWLSRPRPWEEIGPRKLLLSTESADESGVLKMDQPLSSFAERRFGCRFVRSEWIDLPGEGANVSQ